MIITFRNRISNCGCGFLVMLFGNKRQIRQVKTLGDYITVLKEAVGEYSEKHSRFIATLYPCDSEDKANEIISAHKSKYWDARHNVYAYILRDNTAKFSDDGEPHSTAGKPVYDVLLHSNITDALIIVTRYFGGILLGTGGLVRAYSSASRAAVEAAQPVQMVECGVFELRLPYSEQGRIMSLFSDMGIDIIGTEFSDTVLVTFAVKTSDIDKFSDNLRELSSGKLAAEQKGSEILPIIIKK